MSDIKTLDDLQAYIEGRFPCVQGAPYAYCDTGDTYVIIGSLEEGEEFGVWPCYKSYDTEGAALAAAKVGFDAYAAGKSGTLYWRYSPPLQMIFCGIFSPDENNSVEQEYRVHMRLVISDRTVGTVVPQDEVVAA